MYILTLDHPHSASSSFPGHIWLQDLYIGNFKHYFCSSGWQMEYNRNFLVITGYTSLKQKPDCKCHVVWFKTCYKASNIQNNCSNEC